MLDLLRWIVFACMIGFVASCILAFRDAVNYTKPPQPEQQDYD